MIRESDRAVGTYIIKGQTSTVDIPMFTLWNPESSDRILRLKRLLVKRWLYPSAAGSFQWYLQFFRGVPAGWFEYPPQNRAPERRQEPIAKVRASYGSAGSYSAITVVNLHGNTLYRAITGVQFTAVGDTCMEVEEPQKPDEPSLEIAPGIGLCVWQLANGNSGLAYATINAHWLENVDEDR